MIKKAAIIWVMGLLTIVPGGSYYLLFHAPRDQYALLITLVLFWIFGFWGVAGPLLSAIKVRRVFRAIERIKSRDALLETLRSKEAREAAIDLIAMENRIPRFLATRVYGMLMQGLASKAAASPASDEPLP